MITPKENGNQRSVGSWLAFPKKNRRSEHRQLWFGFIEPEPTSRERLLETLRSVVRWLVRLCILYALLMLLSALVIWAGTGCEFWAALETAVVDGAVETLVALTQVKVLGALARNMGRRLLNAGQTVLESTTA